MQLEFSCIIQMPKKKELLEELYKYQIDMIKKYINDIGEKE